MPTDRRLFALVVAGIATFAAPFSAKAASFDCTKAQSKAEKTICGDPTLSDLDSKLAQLYGERMAGLSPAGQELLRASQRNWLRVTDKLCADFKPSYKWQDLGYCLTGSYDARLRELNRVGEQIGPYRLNRIHLSADQIIYPQIDDPKTSAEIAWNKQMARKVEKGHDCDHNIDYELGYANDHFISIEWTTGIYCHGTPHGIWDLNSENMVLAPTLHAITGQDLFGPGDTWESQLQSLFWSALTARGWSPPPDKTDFVKNDILTDVIKPTRWLFTKDGLQFTFSAYQGGCYVCGTKPVTVPWAQLKPLLVPGAPVP